MGSGKDICGRVGVQGYPTIKYYTAKTGRSGADYQGAREFGALKQFVESTFKPSCDPFTQKGCNDQEKRFIEKTKDLSADELVAMQKEKETELKAMKKERSDAQAELRDKEKKWKSKETALNKAVAILKQFQKGG